MSVILGSRLRRRWLSLSGVHSLAENILKAAGASQSDLSLLLVGDRAMRRLNRRYRHKDRTTDVLAFPITPTRPSPLPCPPHLRGRVRVGRGGGSGRELGDVVISLPQAARQAKQAGHSLERELAVLVTHGVLHLLGYDHERGTREASRMQRCERMVLRAVGRIPRMFGTR